MTFWRMAVLAVGALLVACGGAGAPDHTAPKLLETPAASQPAVSAPPAPTDPAAAPSDMPKDPPVVAPSGPAKPTSGPGTTPLPPKADPLRDAETSIGQGIDERVPPQ